MPHICFLPDKSHGVVTVSPDADVAHISYEAASQRPMPAAIVHGFLEDVCDENVQKPNREKPHHAGIATV
jgi:hypothetical protein